MKSLLSGLKWLLVVVLILAFLIGAWVGVAWWIGWAMGKIFELGNCGFSPTQYIGFGSCVLVFTLVVQIITTSLTVWFLVSWGKARLVKTMPGRP